MVGEYEDLSEKPLEEVGLGVGATHLANRFADDVMSCHAVGNRTSQDTAIFHQHL